MLSDLFRSENVKDINKGVRFRIEPEAHGNFFTILYMSFTGTKSLLEENEKIKLAKNMVPESQYLSKVEKNCGDRACLKNVEQSVTV